MQALCQRRQPLNALGAIVERRRAVDHQVQPGEAPGINLVYPLAQAIEPFFPGVSPHSLQSFDFVDYEYQSLVARIAKDGQNAGDKT